MNELDLVQGRKVFSRTGFAMLMVIGVTLVLQVVISIIIGPQRLAEQTWLWFVMALLPQYLIAMPAAALILKGVPSVDIPRKTLKTGHFFILLLICFFLLYFGNLAGAIITLILQVVVGGEMINPLEQIITTSSLWVNLGLVVVLAPVVEELFYRKLLIPRLLRFGEKPAIIVSGLIFGLMHGNLTQFFYAFGLGAAFAYIFIKTGKVIYTIILHVTINFFGSFLAPLAMSSGFLVLGFYGLVVFSLAVAGLVLLILNKKRIAMTAGLFETAQGKTAVFLNVGMMLFLTGCVLLFAANTYTSFAA